MRAAINGLDFEPDPRTLPAEPEAFGFNARLYVGLAGGPGKESFDVTVCSPEWLRERCREVGFLDGLHHLIVNAEDFDERALRAWFEQRVTSIDRDSWHEIATELARLGWWEFEGYRP